MVILLNDIFCITKDIFTDEWTVCLNNDIEPSRTIQDDFFEECMNGFMNI